MAYWQHLSSNYHVSWVQAGVALGLTKIVTQRFPGWGPDFAALMVAPFLLWTWQSLLSLAEYLLRVTITTSCIYSVSSRHTT